MSRTCTQCGRTFEEVGKHWSRSSCNWPELSEYQKNVLTGLLMGDGTMHRPKDSGRSPRISAVSTTKEYLQYIDDKFPLYGVEVVVRSTPEEKAEDIRERFDRDTDPEDCSTVYNWRTRYSPVFSEFAEWYDTGKKVFPDDIELDPVTLKHWYVCDGHFDVSGTAKHIDIGLSNEVENKEKIEKMFERVGFEVSSWNVWDNGAKIRFTREESYRIWEYMGEPLPGFEYKWPEDHRKI